MPVYLSKFDEWGKVLEYFLETGEFTEVSQSPASEKKHTTQGFFTMFDDKTIGAYLTELGGIIFINNDRYPLHKSGLASTLTVGEYRNVFTLIIDDDLVLAIEYNRVPEN